MTKENVWSPLEANPTTKEVFMRVRNHEDIIITPPRPEDVQNIFVSQSDPRIYHWMLTTPKPYLREYAEASWLKSKQHADAALKELEDANSFNRPKLVSSCPVAFIRRVREDGSDEFVGHVTIGRCPKGELMKEEIVDWDHEVQNKAENDSKELGDPTILWSIGNFIAPKFHGQGIMTDVVDTILHDWAVPRMGVRHVLVGAFVENVGSARVFEKNGFRTSRIIQRYREKNHFKVKGKIHGLHLLEWKHESYQM
ncbi:hypothetical protein CPB84DRAFT_1672449 [Gymnopilus junonius]|uniref:N-acetyltransferase domain-containing protein n=1 Tax=Gymnopilus junonius TaxID=109634 RepID=A0A9P5NYA8_GYMJU|nr:hypothetical protein CPB84DRAFT_1672449 [Gymnopilus junonius]